MSNYPEPIPLDERCEEGEEVISRKTIENSIDGENAETYRIVLDSQKVGGVVLQIDKEAAKGELELLFVLPECHSKGIGQAAWKAVEARHAEIRVWALRLDSCLQRCTPSSLS